jgi:hypothetical protein
MRHTGNWRGSALIGEFPNTRPLPNNILVSWSCLSYDTNTPAPAPLSDLDLKGTTGQRGIWDLGSE